MADGLKVTIKDAISGKYYEWNLSDTSIVEVPAPPAGGDMAKSVYDPNEDGIIGRDQIDPAVGAEGPPGPAGADGSPGPQGDPGPAGSDGAPGAQGDQGDPGPQGNDGAQGIPGNDGAQGIPGNDGTAGAQGDQGIQGIQGLQGDAGPQGSAGFPILVVTLKANGLSAWTNMPAAETEWCGAAAAIARLKIDLTTASQSRVIVRIGTAPVANAKFKVQYSTDESVWADLCSVTMPATANKTNVGGWTAVPAGAKADVFIRTVGVDGNGTADPTFGNITLEVI